jgi:TRAP-type C4-dicarboxylate transport system permease small subunit
VHGLSRVLGRIENAMAAAAVTLLALVMLSVCLEVFMRYALNSPLFWVVELSEYALLYICFLGASWALRNGTHIRIDVFLWAFDDRWRRRFGMAASVFGICISSILVIWGLVATWDKFQSGAYKPTVVEFPGWIVVAIIPLGALVLGLRFFLDLVGYASGEKVDETSYDVASE